MPAPTPFVAEDLKSDIPFSNTEPKIFQAEFVVTANGATDKTFAARNGENRRFDYNLGETNQFSLVQIADGKDFVMLADKKIYAESSGDSEVSNTDNPFDFLTTEWLNQKADVKFEKTGAENNLVRYRAILGESGKSEAVIWVDEKINLPVKQEFYSTYGEQKTVNFTFEIKNFKLQTNANLFEIPKDFKKVPIEELRKTLQSKN